MHADMAELADALDLGSSGRPWGFKSLVAHHKPLEIKRFRGVCFIDVGKMWDFYRKLIIVWESFRYFLSIISSNRLAIGSFSSADRWKR